jgi:hypothetical protein
MMEHWNFGVMEKVENGEKKVDINGKVRVEEFSTSA